MRVLSVLAIAVVAASALSDETNDVLDVVRSKKHNNAKFAELEAGILNAAEAGEKSKTGGSGKSAMAQIVAMVDMMLIQVNDDIADLNKDHTAFQKVCKTNLREYSRQIETNKKTEASHLATAMAYRRSWLAKLPRIPALDRSMARRTWENKRDENLLAGAVALRAKRHAAYLKALDEHDKALRDVRAIRQIIQNSKLDDKANVKATVAAGATAGTAQTTAGLVELKKTAHPRLHNVISLAQTAMENGAQGSGIDLIYKLLYQTRDQLNQSKQKLIKSEQAAVGNWRTNKIAARNDINTQKILKATEYMRKGTVKMQIGTAKKIEGKHKITMGEAKKVKDLNQILKDFLEVACAEDREMYASTIALKRGERAALTKVQKKLVEMKWSNKVYKAIEKVSEGVVYLQGAYHIKSSLGRYMINDKGTPKFNPTKTKTKAEQFSFDLNPDDLSYSIKYTSVDKTAKVKCAREHAGNGGNICKCDGLVTYGANGKFASKYVKGKITCNNANFGDPIWGVVKDCFCAGNKKRDYYLTEKNNKVSFGNLLGRTSYWNVVYDKPSNKMFIRNRDTKNQLFVDAKKGFTLETFKQSEDKRSEFSIERPNYIQVGCFKNKVGQQLEHYEGASNTMNTGECFRKCDAAAHKKKITTWTYFGLSEGKQCSCGSKFANIPAAETDCGFICNGRDGDLCGGAMRSLVYRLTPTEKDVYTSPYTCQTFKSVDNMKAQGWRFSWSSAHMFLLPGNHYREKSIAMGAYSGFWGGHPVATLTYTVKASGKVKMNFGCGTITAGATSYTKVSLNGTEKGRTNRGVLSKELELTVKKGDTITVTEHGAGIIILSEFCPPK